MVLASAAAVPRVLLLFTGPIDTQAMKARWEQATADGMELGLCYQLRPGQDGFRDALHAQQEVTVALRLACGARAESVPVFAVSDRDGERAEDYARSWGATVVRA